MNMKLSEMKYAEEGIVTHIEETLRKKVAGMGISPGKKLRMLTKQPVKGPVVVVVDEANTSIGLDVAESILVEIPGVAYAEVEYVLGLDAALSMYPK
jgi:ferrous iron transport protein A